jgi:ABC-2 type transport system ATP-binding protein
MDQLIPPPALEVYDLTKRYGDHAVLDKLNLKLPPASLVGLLGPNGAGKTTLLKSLAGLVKPEKGTIKIAGHDLSTQESEARRYLAYVPDVPNFYVELTVIEHMELLARAHNAMADFATKSERLLRRFGLWEARHQPSFTLSRGMSQKLSICCGFIRPSKVMLLDEPGGTLDIRSVSRLYEMLDEYRQEGGLAIFSSHQWEALQDFCDMFVLVDRGQTLAVGGLDFLRESADLPPDAGLRDIYLAFMDDDAAFDEPAENSADESPAKPEEPPPPAPPVPPAPPRNSAPPKSTKPKATPNYRKPRS